MSYPLKAEGDRAWQETVVDKLIGGINTHERPDQLDPSQMQRCLNMVLRQGKAIRDTGYVAFAGVVAGIPQRDYQFFRKSGSSELMLVTTASVYKYSPVAAEWQYVKGTVSTTLTAQANATATDLAVTAIAGFSNGDKIGILLDNGMQHKTTINGVPAGTTIVMLAPIPAGRFAALGAVLMRAVALTGTLDFHVSIVTLASHDWFVFTNGVNVVKRYDGTDCVDVPNLPSTGDTICRDVAVYNNALFLLNTLEGGTAHPQRVRRSDAGDPTEWVAGTAGYNDLFDEPSYVTCGRLLGPYLIVYRENSIMRGEFVGSGGVNYTFLPMIPAEGVLSTLDVVELGDYHVIRGKGNIYEYRAGFDLTPIGDNVYYMMFGPQADVNPGKKHRSFSFNVQELNEVWFFHPTINSDLCNILVRYNIKDKNFAERRFASMVCGFGFYKQQDGFAWVDLVGSWAEQVWQWNSRVVQSAAATVHLCSATAGQVYEYDYYSITDAGLDISYSMETKDFVLQNGDLRHDAIEGFARGSDLLIEYSTDEGESWRILGAISNPAHGKFHAEEQFVTSRMRYKFSGSDPQSVLSFFNFFWKIESLTR